MHREVVLKVLFHVLVYIFQSINSRRITPNSIPNKGIDKVLAWTSLYLHLAWEATMGYFECGANPQIDPIKIAPWAWSPAITPVQFIE